MKKDTNQIVIKSKKTKKRYRGIKIFAIVVSLISFFIVVGLVGTSIINGERTASEAYEIEQRHLKQQIGSLKMVNNQKKSTDSNEKNVKYGAQNSGIPNKAELQKYAKQGRNLEPIGMAAANQQPGLKNKLIPNFLYPGTSDAVLANGIGVDVPHYKMGQGNNIFVNHNYGGTILNGNYTLGFSPLQKLNPAYKPKYYVTDGQTLYTYQLDRKYSIDVKENPRAYKDKVLSDMSTNKVTLVTCNEPRYGFINLNPNKRIVVTGPLVSVQPLTNAPVTVQKLFAQIK